MQTFGQALPPSLVISIWLNHAYTAAKKPLPSSTYHPILLSSPTILADLVAVAVLISWQTHRRFCCSWIASRGFALIQQTPTSTQHQIRDVVNQKRCVKHFKKSHLHPLTCIQIVAATVHINDYSWTKMPGPVPLAANWSEARCESHSLRQDGNSAAGARGSF